MLKLSAPLRAQLEITNFCNHGCEYCYNSSNLGNNSLSKEDAKRIINQLNDNKVYSIVLTGGEPFSNKPLLYYCLEQLESTDIEPSINTNLSLFKKEDLKQLDNINGILVSFPSYKEDSFNRITNSKNYGKIIHNLNLLDEIEVMKGVNMVVTKSNKDDIYETGRFLCENFGIDYFSASPLIPYSKEQEEKLFFGDVNKIINSLKKVNKDYGVRVDVLEVITPCSVSKDVRNYSSEFFKSCTAGISDIAIDSYGGVHPCPSVDVSYGNLIESDLSNIWENMSDWRKIFENLEFCDSCDSYLKCRGGCRQRAFVSTGSYAGKDSFFSEPLHNSKDVIYNKIEFEEDAIYKKKNIRYREEKKDIYLITAGKNIIFGNGDLLKFIQELPEEIEYEEQGEYSKSLLNYLYVNGLLYKV
ncbi:MAG: radical SAM protein [Promethearchaeota archaeon]